MTGVLHSFIPLLFLVLGIMTLFITFKNKLLTDTKKEKQPLSQFLEEEWKATFIMKKEIPSNLFISINWEAIPSVEDNECYTIYNKIKRYQKLKMVNLKGMTNLEIKKNYGINYLESLINYEKNYFSFMDILIKYGTILDEKNFITESRKVLELAIIQGCDRSKCYFLLADIYEKQQDFLALEELSRLARKNMADSHYLDKVLDKIDKLR